jgi:hypothetical protein
MNVKELIELLSKAPPDLEVLTGSDYDYLCGVSTAEIVTLDSRYERSKTPGKYDKDFFIVWC